MWEYGHHFRIENFDAENITQDYGVEVEFDQSSRSSHRDQNLVQGTLGSRMSSPVFTLIFLFVLSSSQISM